jgi:hypothetical protein
MNFQKFEIDYQPGDTYREPPGGQQRTAEEAARERAEARIHVVAEFRKAAQASTRAQIEPVVTHLLALCIQLRGVGGNGAETNIASKLREAADFLEDRADL